MPPYSCSHQADIEQLRAQAAAVEGVREELESEKQMSRQLQTEIAKLREQGTIHAVLRDAEQQRAEAMERAPKEREEKEAGMAEVQAAEHRAQAAWEKMQKLQSAIQDVRGELESERLISQQRLTEIDELREKLGSMTGPSKMHLINAAHPSMNNEVNPSK